MTLFPYFGIFEGTIHFMDYRSIFGRFVKTTLYFKTKPKVYIANKTLSTNINSLYVIYLFRISILIVLAHGTNSLNLNFPPYCNVALSNKFVLYIWNHVSSTLQTRYVQFLAFDRNTHVFLQTAGCKSNMGRWNFY